MSSALERWLHLSLRGQVAIATACLGMASMALWLLLLQPQRLAQQALRSDIARLEQSYQQQQAQLKALPVEGELRSQLADVARQLDELSHSASLEAVLAARGSQLSLWQPESEPRALTLLLAWSQFQPLFAELAQSAAPFPVRFLLESQQEKIEARLWLESNDAR